MAVISGVFGSNNDVLEERLYQVDFSRHTDLKEKLAAKLFKTGTSKMTKFAPLSDEEVEFVNAAQGILEKNPFDHGIQ